MFAFTPPVATKKMQPMQVHIVQGSPAGAVTRRATQLFTAAREELKLDDAVVFTTSNLMLRQKHGDTKVKDPHMAKCMCLVEYKAAIADGSKKVVIVDNATINMQVYLTCYPQDCRPLEFKVHTIIPHELKDSKRVHRTSTTHNITETFEVEDGTHTYEPEPDFVPSSVVEEEEEEDDEDDDEEWTDEEESEAQLRHARDEADAENSDVEDEDALERFKVLLAESSKAKFGAPPPPAALPPMHASLMAGAPPPPISAGVGTGMGMGFKFPSPTVPTTAPAPAPNASTFSFDTTSQAPDGDDIEFLL
jgi:hypothetical protein